MFSQICQERDDVVFNLPFDLVDPVNVELAQFPNGFGCAFRDDTQFGLGVTGMGLDLEPNTELVFGSQILTISGRA